MITNTAPTSSALSEVLKQESVQSVVHDLRGPMTVIKGNLLILLSGMMGSMSEDQMQLLRRSVGPLEELILMTENMLQVSKLEANAFDLQLTTTDLDRLLSDTIDFYQVPFHERHMQIYREGNTVGVKMSIDAFWVKRVLQNLIWNAFKFTPDQGRVILQVEHKDDGIEIIVQDTGRGIPSNRLESLFEKFTQVSQSDRKSGTGLGLWICKRIMELHGGSITAQSADGLGSKFILFFPSELILA